MKPKLSVNINKIALLRNSRGTGFPSVIEWAKDCERYKADGITVHPRQDERHITYDDVKELKSIVKTEFNVEGYPDKRFLDLIRNVKPDQCTLVPDASKQLTSDHGWDLNEHLSFVSEVVHELRSLGIRTALFMDPDVKALDLALKTTTDRIELYTGPYADNYGDSREEAIKDYVDAAIHCNNIGLGINAGHDLNLSNLRYFKSKINDLLEVSIGHALTIDCLYFGLENAIQMYQRELIEE